MTTPPPRWQLDSIFTGGLEGEPFQTAREALVGDLDAFERLMDDRAVGGGALAADRDPDRDPDLLADLLVRLDALVGGYRDLGAFVSCHTSTDAFDAVAQRERSRLVALGARLGTLEGRLRAWLRGGDPEALAGRLADAGVRTDYRHTLRRAVEDAEHRLGDEAEAVAASLDATGGGAWGRLHDTLIGRATVDAALGGEERAFNLSELVGFQASPDPAERRRAFEGELALLARDEVAYAAAMNGVKGQVLELSGRRGWADPLALSLFQNGVDRDTLDAMHEAVRDALPTFRRYLAAKARRLGQGAMTWADLRAPVVAGPPPGEPALPWEEAADTVLSAFRRYSPDLAAFGASALAQGWVDAPPRRGKTPGAFCSSVPGRRESRVLLNVSGTVEDALTLAHELGHAYHNHCGYAAGRTALQQRKPMTLAETASIFCETLVADALLEGSSGESRLSLLEEDLSRSTQVVVDIHARFLFESRVFESRREGELSADELGALMLGAQAETYGAGLHPLMWAHKSHYYDTGLSFYNYPYTFGYLFGLGLYTHYRAAPRGFVERYDALLADTGLAGPAELAARFDVDLRDSGFWRAGLEVAAARVTAFEGLAERAGRAAPGARA